MRALPAAVLAHALCSALAPVLPGAFALDAHGRRRFLPGPRGVIHYPEAECQSALGFVLA